MHAEMWVDRLQAADDGRARLLEALRELWPYALGVVDGSEREEFRARVARRLPFFEATNGDAVERGTHTEELRPLWEEMTMVRRSVPGAAW